jgi:hypothetical protein
MDLDATLWHRLLLSGTDCTRSASGAADCVEQHCIVMNAHRGTQQALSTFGYAYCRSYARLASNGEPRYYLPTDSLPLLHAAASLASSRRIGRWVRVARALAAGRGPWRDDAPVIVAMPEPPPLERWLCGRLGVNDVRLGWSTGNSGAYRKHTVQVLCPYSGETLAYVRIANQPLAKEMLQNERERLVELAAHPSIAPSVPAVLAEMATDDALLTLISGAPDGASSNRFNHTHLDFLNRLRLLAVRSGTFAVSPVMCEISRALEELEHSERSADIPQIRALIETLNSVFGNTILPYPPAHRDFTAWNTRACGSHGLFVFDWEFSRPEWLPLLDMFHYYSMPCLLSGRKAGPLWEKYRRPWAAHATQLSIDPALVTPLYGVYLVDTAVFYLLARVRAPHVGDETVLKKIQEQMRMLSVWLSHQGSR